MTAGPTPLLVVVALGLVTVLGRVRLAPPPEVSAVLNPTG